MSDSSTILPEGWVKTLSNKHNQYYYSHTKTQVNQWHRPTFSEVRDPSKAKRKALINLAKFKDRLKKRPRENEANNDNKKSKINNDGQSVAIIVPYRDLHVEQNRARHLRKFLPHMQQFLEKLVEKKMIRNFHVYIIEQSDDRRKFNRGKLLNIGFDYAIKYGKKKGLDHDVFIFHDVDLLPGADLGSWYSRFPKSPLHIARCWDRYANNPKYFGGIVSFSEKDMRRINGFPNTFWGWGGEDDEMQKRCEKLNVKWEYPPKGTITDLEDMSLQEKLSFLKKNKSWKCMVKWEALEEHEKTWKINGLADLSYQVLNKTNLDPKNDPGNMTKLSVDVKLNGNHWLNDKCGVDYIGY